MVAAHNVQAFRFMLCNARFTKSLPSYPALPELSDGFPHTGRPTRLCHSVRITGYPVVGQSFIASRFSSPGPKRVSFEKSAMRDCVGKIDVTSVFVKRFEFLDRTAFNRSPQTLPDRAEHIQHHFAAQQFINFIHTSRLLSL